MLNKSLKNGKMVSAKIPSELYNDIEKLSQISRVTKSVLVRQILKAFFTKEPIRNLLEKNH